LARTDPGDPSGGPAVVEKEIIVDLDEIRLKKFFG